MATGGDRRHIAHMLETFEEAATDSRKFCRLAALARVHEALNSPLEFAMRDTASSRPLGECLLQTAVGRPACRRRRMGRP